MNRINAAFLVATVVIAGAGCSSSGQKISGKFDGATFYATQARVGECIFVGPSQEAAALFGSLAAAIFPTLISQGIDRIGTMLKTAGEAQTKVALANANFIAKNGKFPSCIQIARGEFFASCEQMLDAKECKKGSPSPKGTWLEVTKTRFAGKLGKLVDTKLYFAKKPDFFFEGLLRFSGTNNDPAWTVAPAYVTFNQPLSSRTLSSDSARGITVNFGFYKAGDQSPNLVTETDGKEKLTTLASGTGASINLGMVETETELIFDLATEGTGTSNDSTGSTQIGNALPSVGTTVGADSGTQFSGGAPPVVVEGGSGDASGGGTGTAIGGNPNTVVDQTSKQATGPLGVHQAMPLESNWFAVKWTTGSASTLDTEPHPAAVRVAVSETQGGNEFLAFLGDVFTDENVKKGIADAVTGAVLPPTSEKREQEITAEITGLTNLFRARDEAYVALQVCATNGTVLTLQTARDKMLLANKQANLIKEKEPFPQSLPSLLDKAQIEKDCQTQLGDKLVVIGPTSANMAAYDKAVATAFAALNTCETSGKVEDALNARAALRDVSTMAGTADKPPVDAEALTVSGMPDQVKASCKKFRNSLSL